MTEHDDPIETTLDKLKPVFARLSFGSVMGYCSGYAAKKVGKAVAFVVGAGFIIFQTAAYSGYIDIDWAKIKDDTKAKIDITGDGKLDVEDAKAYWRKVRKILTHNVGSAGGFSLGFLGGVKYG
mmetsp:Transcript_20660/g.23137  ORF Transcript_20660/g.23137 Transcript_20660/m.23137 type:complete len:124 (-) Transcript_20660:212-583(-)|eukprot:CAMPEP_0195255846 /NCGR_PEP_ID=MMETSP0706-20130129/5888_1 /TAXON_ID=33640 /ORGANISM="Asterionellopsis glacialis, Strain CCMP134" /LENGTH=123 /DNA_ID=CAMNT_0040308785 /DNA_START=41 /DNA_END=412 /DNA_ORIENTATION=+